MAIELEDILQVCDPNGSTVREIAMLLGLGDGGRPDLTEIVRVETVCELGVHRGYLAVERREIRGRDRKFYSPKKEIS